MSRRPGHSASAGRRGGSRLTDPVSGWLLRHLQVLISTLGSLSRSPFNTLMTAAVVGIALALPSALYKLLENGEAVRRGLEGAAQISLFLHHEVNEARGRAFAAELTARSDLAAVHYISPDEALAEYQEMSGLTDVLEVMEHNPLPAVVVVIPVAEHAGVEAVRTLVEEFAAAAEVELAQFDQEWVRRLDGLTALFERGVVIIAALLGAAVLLIVGNTIRLTINTRRQEIEVAKLVGATDAFVRRPFLYTGLWFGILGSLLAWLLVALALELLSGPVNRLAALYYSDFRLLTVTLTDGLLVTAAGAGLGLVGSWIAVGRHLQEIQPS